MSTRMQFPNHRVLIFAKSEDTIDPLTFLLNIAGYEVLSVGNDSEALAAATLFQPSICLLTRDGGDSNPQELAQKLRNSFPNGGMILAELGSGQNGGEVDWNIDLHFTDAENNFQIVEKLEQYLHETVIVA